MVEKETWVFADYCSDRSKLGLLLLCEVRKIKSVDKEINEEEIRRRALVNLGETIGCEIKPFDFLGLGARQYLNMRKDVREGIKRRINLAMTGSSGN